MRVNKDVKRGIEAWLSGSDKYLFAHGLSLAAARQLLAKETGIIVSPAAFHRIVMFSRTRGRAPRWRGQSDPLPTNGRVCDAGISLLYAAAEVTDLLPNVNLRGEDPAFVARLFCSAEVPVSPAEAAQLIDCVRKDSEAPRDRQRMEARA